MSKKILSIACSPTRLVFCQHSVQLHGCTLLRHHSILLKGIHDPQLLAREIASVIDSKDLRSEEYRVALPSSFAMFRNWTFPFSSKKQIAQALEFELEQEIPLPLEHCVTSTVFGAKHSEGRDVVSATLPGNVLKTFLEELQHNEINPQIVTLDALSLNSVVEKLEVNTPTLLLHIDTEQILLLYVKEKVTYAIARIPNGMNELKVTLQRKLNTSEDDIERKLFFTDLAANYPTSSTDSEFQKTLVVGLQKIAKQILLCENTISDRIDAILLSGEIAKIQGVEKFFSHELATPTTVLHKHPKADTLSKIEDKNDFIESLPAIGLAIESTSLRHQQHTNFRKKEFSYRKAKDPLTDTVKYCTAIACIILLAWSAALFAQGYSNALKAEKLNSALNKTLRKTLPDLKGSFGTIQYTSILKSRLAQLQGNANSKSSHSAVDTLDVLLALHKNTPKQLDVVMEKIRVSEKTVDLSGTANSYNTLEKLRSHLSKAKLFKAVTIRGAANQKNKKRVRFELEVEKAS